MTADNTPSIANAIVVKDDDLFLVCDRSGLIPLTTGHAFGLYHRDCRYISGYELCVADTCAASLSATAARGFSATIELANVALHLDDGHDVDANRIVCTWTRVLDGARATLRDEIAFTSFAQHALTLPLTITIVATFEDVFSVRKQARSAAGTLHPPTWRDGVLETTYDGIDDVRRIARVQFHPAPTSVKDGTAAFQLHLDPGECATLSVSVALSEGEPQPPKNAQDVDTLVKHLDGERQRWLRRHVRIDSDSTLLNRLVERSVCDLHMLRTRLDDSEFIAAGIPWFVALFGRDSAVTALESLAFDHHIAEQTLRLLARYQGTRVDESRDEQPGKIHHELRVGELTRAGKVPYSPYYGSIDSTMLFLILLGRHATWTGDLTLFTDLRAHVDRALDWMARFGDVDGSGYIAYDHNAPGGLTNQGWKDSGDAIVNADGSLATPPIALAEVQGYTFMAKRLIAELFRRSGDPHRADALEHEAQVLKTRFKNDFWFEDGDCFALALESGRRQANVVSSNAGQVLWSGIADDDKARRTSERLSQKDMFSGWGIRTLSSDARRYNPIGYHVGTVWPHDNALIASGCRRYRLDDVAARIVEGIMSAGMSFEHYRLPELFAGFARDDLETPVRYPVANHPQAWGAASVLYLIETMLGLVPEAFDRRLRIVRPMLPTYVDRLDLCGVRVADAVFDVRFSRRDDDVGVDVLRSKGDVDVVVER